MEKDGLNNIHIAEESVLITPAQLKQKMAVSKTALAFIEAVTSNNR